MGILGLYAALFERANRASGLTTPARIGSAGLLNVLRRDDIPEVAGAWGSAAGFIDETAGSFDYARNAYRAQRGRNAICPVGQSAGSARSVKHRNQFTP